MNSRNFIKLFVVLLSVVLFSGCGGGNGDTVEGTSDSQTLALNKIIAYANGSDIAPSIEDYVNAGLSGLTPENVALLNEAIIGLTTGAIDTADKLQALLATFEVQITGNVPPIAKGGATPTEVKTGETVRFSSTLSKDVDGKIEKYLWFEDGVVVARVPSFFKVYNVAGSYNIKLVVTDDDGATSSNTFTITVTPSQSTFENTTPTAIPDGITNIDIPASDAVTSIQKVTVMINLTTPYSNELIISLRSPAGTIIILSNRRGNFGAPNDTFEGTTFDDDAAESITTAAIPFSGTYMPEDPLSTFNGENSNGTWTLIVNDVFINDGGLLNSWSITVE